MFAGTRMDRIYEVLQQGPVAVKPDGRKEGNEKWAHLLLQQY